MAGRPCGDTRVSCFFFFSPRVGIGIVSACSSTVLYCHFAVLVPHRPASLGCRIASALHRLAGRWQRSTAAMSTLTAPVATAIAPIVAAVAPPATAATSAAVTNAAAAGATPAMAVTAALTPAAAARAKKLASGGMNFVERPNAVYISARNLAPPPPPPPPAQPLLPSASPALVVAAEAGPVVPAFSVVRWLCTSRSAWSWLVRLLGVASVAALAFAAVKVYQAWLADMKRRQAWREENRLLTLRNSEPKPEVVAGSSDAAMPSSSSGAGNFQRSEGEKMDATRPRRYLRVQCTVAHARRSRACML